MYELFAFAAAKTRNRDPCPSTDHLSDIFFICFFFQQHILFIIFIVCFDFCKFLLQSRQPSILKFCQFIQIIAALSAFHFLFNGIDLFFHFAHTGNRSFFAVPAFNELFIFLSQLRQLFFNFHQPFFRLLILFFAKGLSLDLQLQYPPLTFVKRCRKRIDLGPQSCCRLIDQINRLIRQKTIVDITVTHYSSRN